MFTLNLKIAFRSLWRNGRYSAINILGLSVALAVFIIVILYVGYETSYDKDLPNYDRIYLVGRKLPDFRTDYTPAVLSKAIKEKFPEVELAGATKNIDFEIPLTSDHGKIFVNKPLQVEVEVAKMFNIDPKANGVASASGIRAYLPELLYRQLFPKANMRPPQLVLLGPSNGAQAEQISGTLDRDAVHSNLEFDLLALANDISFGDRNYRHNSFRTYLQLKEGTDVATLEKKIDRLYKEEWVKSGGALTDRDILEDNVIYLDPLSNLHLQPKAGSDTGYKIVIALFSLGLLIMVIACINFTNLMIVQTTKRAKEIGVKKVMGASRVQLALQILMEIFLQCLLSLILGMIVAELLLPAFNQMFDTRLSILDSAVLYWQLPALLLTVVLVSGTYPALVLSGFQPVAVLKGNLQTSYKTAMMRKILLTGQFAIAIIFIGGLLIVNSQLSYMHTEETGFRPKQVLAIKNMVHYSNPSVFKPVRDKMMKIPGVNNVTVTSDIPDGSKAGTMKFSVGGQEAMSDFLFVDFDYFETLEASIKLGRSFDRRFSADTSNSAILNETAVAQYGLANPLGKIIKGCDIDYQIVGVVKDLKTKGFQQRVEPTVYTIKNPCAGTKNKIMINIDEERIPLVLANLKANWSDINKFDGDDFRYEFLDVLYGRLFRQQERLRSVFFFGAMLTVFIAILGLFAFSAITTQARLKEISVRRILGATDIQILKLLNTYYFWIVLVANLIAWPVIYVLAINWLSGFAFRIAIPFWPFLVAGLATSSLSLLTVSLQVLKVLKTNSAQDLKYE